MKQLDITTALDLVGLGAMSVGVAWGLWPFLSGFSLILAGAVVILGSYFASRR